MKCKSDLIGLFIISATAIISVIHAQENSNQQQQNSDDLDSEQIEVPSFGKKLTRSRTSPAQTEVINILK